MGNTGRRELKVNIVYPVSPLFRLWTGKYYRRFRRG